MRFNRSVHKYTRALSMTLSQGDPLASTKKIRFNGQKIKRTKDEVNHYIIINYQILPISRLRAVCKSLLLSYNMYYIIYLRVRKILTVQHIMIFYFLVRYTYYILDISYFIIKRIDYKKRKQTYSVNNEIFLSLYK